MEMEYYILGVVTNTIFRSSEDYYIQFWMAQIKPCSLTEAVHIWAWSPWGYYRNPVGLLSCL